MKELNIAGSIFGHSGYDIHTSELANAFYKIGIKVNLLVDKPRQWERFVSDAELEMCMNNYNPNAPMLAITMPQQWSILKSKKPSSFIGYCVWEGDTIPSYWTEYLEMADLIIAPSKHTFQAIMNEYPEHHKIKIVPHGYNPKYFFPENKKENDKLIFIAHKGWVKGLYDRGGIQWLIKAFNNAFDKDNKVELRIKINSTYNNNNFDIKKQMDKLKIDRTGKAPIYTTVNYMDSDTLRSFYNEGDVFVTTSMAEAFNLPCLEAMACGLPVMTTGYGGQRDFINNKNGWVVCKGSYGYFSNELLYEDVKWFKPSIKELSRVMRKIYDNQSEIEKKKKKAIDSAQPLTWENTAKQLSKLIF